MKTLATIAVFLVSVSAFAAAPTATAKATLKDSAGKTVGEVKLTELADGVLVAVTVEGLSEGAHAFHVHETGKCEGAFDTAGKHFNPNKKPHGFHGKGPHAGDMPNLHVPASGTLKVEQVVKSYTLKKGKHSLLDADGSAFVVHASADDYQSDPAGNAGGRIACGVVEKDAAVPTPPAAVPATDAGTK
jgi:superoxide dismutase, Cu-Zn family